MFESLTFHWDHGTQYMMYSMLSLLDWACVQVGLSRVVLVYLSVRVLSLHTACLFACCALRTVRTLSELRLSECPSLCLCLHALTVSNRDECLVTLKSYGSAF